MAPPDGAPDEGAAAAIVQGVLGVAVTSCVRFPTGLRHWVYDVVAADGRAAVVRLAAPGRAAEIAGGVLWTDRLRAVGVPVAGVLAADPTAPQPYAVLERLPGSDLGQVYDDLDEVTRRRVLATVGELHLRTRRLPPAPGFGYATGDDTPLEPTWPAVLHASLDRARSWIDAAGIVDPAWSDRVEARLRRDIHSVHGVEPRAFLHDATTKNVIVHEGEVSGVVDVDEMGFGDALWATALTRVSLLGAGRDAAPVEAQVAVLDPAARRRDRLDLYGALHALTLLGELGHAFNRAEAPPVDAGHVAHLEAVLAAHL